MKDNCKTCWKVTGILRILLGLAMIYFGITKFGASPEKIQAIGNAAASLPGLDFLSAGTRFWIAVVGELVAGLFLLTGHWYKIGAILTLIIMVFATNAMGWNMNALFICILTTIVLMQGPGAWVLCKGKCCKGAGACCGTGSCCGPNCGCDKCKGKCDGGSCDMEQQQQQ